MEQIDDILGDAAPKVGEGAPNRGNAGKGRAKGVPNKLTAVIKDAIRDSLTPAALEVKRQRVYGATFARTVRELCAKGESLEAAERDARLVAQGTSDAITDATPADYMQWLATAEPRAYATLLGKLLPTTLQGDDDGGPVRFEKIVREIVPAKK